MKLPGTALGMIAVVASLLVAAGCGQATSAPSATPAVAAAPAKAAEPTRSVEPTRAVVPTVAAQPAGAASAQPASSPVAKSDFPVKGQSINLIVPYAAGGATDIAARLLAGGLEGQLGTPVQVVNKGGGGTQIGATELTKAKPDGCTLGYTVIPTTNVTYLDSSRGAAYTRKDFQGVANHYLVPNLVTVSATSPYKTLKDLIDAAKTKPGEVKVGTIGIMTTHHFAALSLQKAADVKFAMVHFDGEAPAMTALLGGHVDVIFNTTPSVLPQLKTDAVRVLGVMDGEESKFLQGVKTVEAQGYKASMAPTAGISVPGGTPRSVVDVLASAVKKVIDTDEHRKKMEEMGYTLRYMSPDSYATAWNEMDAKAVQLMQEAGR